MALVNFESLNAAFEKHNSSWLVGVGLVVTFAITNIIGIKVFSKLEIVLTAGMWLSLMIFGILGRGRAGRASRRLVRRLGSRHVGAGRAVAGRDGDVHVRRLRVRHAARAGNEGAGQDDSARDGAGPVGVAICMFLYGAAIRRQAANVPVSADGPTHLLDTPGAIPAFALQVLGPFGRIWFGIAFQRRRRDDQHADGRAAAHPVRDGSTARRRVLRLPASRASRRRWSVSSPRRSCRSFMRG